ncbi:hypothetical protein VII00023_18494 [Vibrio ichthyoenteri ATCC 700023]|uniref:Multidrug resistance protein NorM n=1 Tax=Vibrio ichthyoenteri ATCC 700023 TaxID=870968 RepID=F9S0K7_9VIBR|nr:MATE family efflux transporter [Vibrio ichthyoenteri]EGU43185.1 hypothetical protein VII00023_18494 [Vibrio ichthyoenteri ATCC 700023]
MKIYKNIFTLAVPIALHSMLFSCLGFVDTYMLAKLGGDTIAAAGIGAKILWFVLNLIVGVGGGTAIFCAQYWGAKDLFELHKMIHIGLFYSALTAIALVPVLYFFAPSIAGLMTNDDAIIALASGYLKITALTIVVSAFSVIWSAGMRALQKPKVVLYLFVVELVLNITFNYLLIFGFWGLPALGLLGAAWGTLAARLLSTLLFFVYIYYKQPYLMISIHVAKQTCHWTAHSTFLKISLPIIAGEFIWSGGVFIYHAIYGNISTTALAAISILSPIEVMTSALSWGCAAAVGILIGEKIGAAQQKELNDYVTAGFISAISVGLLLVGLLWFSRHAVLGLFSEIEADVQTMLYTLFPFVLASIFLRSITMTAMSGILKSGGDTQFTMKLDFCAQWLGAVPLSLIFAFWFRWPVEMVICAVLLEEGLKLIPILYRIKSGAWIKKLAKSTSKESHSLAITS